MLIVESFALCETPCLLRALAKQADIFQWPRQVRREQSTRLPRPALHRALFSIVRRHFRIRQVRSHMQSLLRALVTVYPNHLAQ